MFSWDPNKAVSNFEKHRVSFEEATTIFVDPSGLEVDDLRHSLEERRLKRLGISILGRVLLVVYAARRSIDGKETIRIISARQASRKERAAYARP